MAADYASVQGSPPPEERTFVDDDGTKFVWDSTLRKFRPDDMAPPQAGTQQQPAPAGQGIAAAVEYTQVHMHASNVLNMCRTIASLHDIDRAEPLNYTCCTLFHALYSASRNSLCCTHTQVASTYGAHSVEHLPADLFACQEISMFHCLFRAHLVRSC